MNKSLKIKGCNDCPFRCVNYDDYAVGPDSMDTCNLATHYNQSETFLRVYNASDSDKPIPTPKWCPLGKSTLKIKLIDNE